MEGVMYLMLPAFVILFAFIVLDRVIDLFETIIDFVMGTLDLMPDVEQIMTYAVQVFVPPVLMVGAFAGVLGSVLFLYLALLDMLEAPTTRARLLK